MIELYDDFRDILVELHHAGAHFVVLGGYAVAFHGHPRATKDLDVLVEADPENAKRVYAALAAFGAPLSAFDVGDEDFASYDGVLQLGVPPRRIDIINHADGISFAEARRWRHLQYRGLRDPRDRAQRAHQKQACRWVSFR